MIEIAESGMIFRFAEDVCFVIENDPVVRGSEGVKACECVCKIVRGRDEELLFLEAKSSAPKEKFFDRGLVSYNGSALPEKWHVVTDFDTYIGEICQKFQDSFMVFHAMKHGMHGTESAARLPEQCKKVKITSPLFVLVINGFQEDWLQPLNDALKKRMRHFLNAWNLRDTTIKTVNPELAKDLGLPIA